MALFFINFSSYAQELKDKSSREILAKNKINDTIQNPIKDSLAIQPLDTIKPKEVLETQVLHTADSLIRQDVKNNKILLYKNAHVHYTDIDLTAGQIEIDNNTNIVVAKGIKDSIGGYSELPIFVQGNETTTQDSIRFNIKTKRAKIWGMKTEQDGIFITGSTTKKENDSTIYVRDIKFTTSDKEHPDYYIKTRKAKIVPNKKIVLGGSNMVIADVPTPLFLPFAYIPITKDRASGFLLPTWGDNIEQGFFLQNGGYYFALNDYVDLAVMTDIYTNGSWGIRSESSYYVKYRFSGNFSFRFENLINSIRGYDGYSKRKNFNLRISHSQDSKANPNSRISASVNLGSSTYYRESLNEINNNSFLNNTLSSSISYYRNLVGTPFNFSVSATHSQNTNTEVINMTLPSFVLNMDRIYPFASKVGAKKNAIQKIGLNYGLKADNRIQTTDDEFFKKEMFESAKNGIQHTSSLSTSLKLAKYFTLSPSANYKEVWYFDRINKTYDADADEVVTDTINKFSTFREYSGGASLSTTLYGTKTFKKGRLKAIRTVMRPSVSYSYRPDFSFYYKDVQQSADPDDVIDFSPYQNGLYGGPGKGISNSLSYSLNSTVEAKVMSKDSTEVEAKKVTILNSLNFSTSYNIAADSLKWSPVRMTASTSLFDKKLSLNLNATMDPYALNVNNTRIGTYNIDNGGGLFRLTNAGMTMNYSFSSSSGEKKGGGQSQNDNDNNSDGIFGEDMAASNELPGANNKNETKTAEVYNAKFPWTMRVAYAVNYSNTRRQNEISNNSLMFSGDLELTPKWKIGFSSGYDFKGDGFTYTQLRFSRDLDSWKLNFNWVPFGTRQTYYFFIGIKASMLSDLKYDQHKLPDQRLF